MPAKLESGRPGVRPRATTAVALTAFLCLATALGLRYVLNQTIGNALPFVTVFGATAAAQWYGGRRAAIPVALLGLVGAVLMLAPAPTRTRVDEVGGAFGIVVFLFTSALIIGFGEAARAAHGAVITTDRLLSAIVDSSEDAIVRKRLDGTIETWNAGAERVFGYRAADAIGKHISIVIPPERIDEEERIIATLKAGGRISHFETERRRADGTPIWVSLTISPIVDDTGAVVAASKIARDVTARIQAEAERETLVKVLENSQDFIGLCDLQGVPFFVNRAGLTLVGLDSLEQAKRTPLAEFFFPEDRDRIIGEFLPRVLRDGQGEVDVRFRHFKTGAARWMAYKVLTLTDRAGNPTGFATVSQDVTERKALADDLVEADRRKNEFLAMLAHELRNPLAPLSNAIQAIKRRAPGDDKTVAIATDILERQIRQMSRLVNDLLDASRVSRGKMELHLARIALQPVVEEAIETARPLVTRLEHTLTVTLPPEPLYVDGDAGRLSQVVGNLLTNAAKFTDRGGHIQLSVSREGEEAVIRVCDDGIGVAREHLERLFEMFVQVDTSIERSRDGLGIGLTLVKRLVELHGGTIEARSEGPRRGSEFIVRLAARPAPFETHETLPLGPRFTDSGSRRVLVGDDSHDAADSLAMLLEFEGHEAYKAHDGAEAVRMAERIRPDIVLMDIGLPILNGYEACRRIRAHAWGAGVVMVAITGWGQEEDREQSDAAGFDLHLVKPVDDAELLRVVASAPRRASA